jgi:GrpB-like predicted nucleotidyltransferase (UPF0157 family)
VSDGAVGTSPRAEADHDPTSVVPYDPLWPELFAALGRTLRRELGAAALRIDHIGSTAVPGLAAKPIIDVQISVAALEPVAAYRGALERAGFSWRSDNPDRMKRYFRERPGAPRTHVHVRAAGGLSEQLALLFRDYLRSDAEWALRYAAEKRRFAHLLGTDRAAYVEAKEPFVWETLRRANRWAQRSGWIAGPSDA